MSRPEWAADLIGDMFRAGIKQIELADKLGVSREFLNRVLTGKQKAPSYAPERYREAFDEIVAEREE